MCSVPSALSGDVKRDLLLQEILPNATHRTAAKSALPNAAAAKRSSRLGRESVQSCTLLQRGGDLDKCDAGFTASSGPADHNNRPSPPRRSVGAGLSPPPAGLPSGAELRLRCGSFVLTAGLPWKQHRQLH